MTRKGKSETAETKEPPPLTLPFEELPRGQGFHSICGAGLAAPELSPGGRKTSSWLCLRAAVLSERMETIPPRAPGSDKDPRRRSFGGTPKPPSTRHAEALHQPRGTGRGTRRGRAWRPGHEPPVRGACRPAPPGWAPGARGCLAPPPARSPACPLVSPTANSIWS